MRKSARAVSTRFLAWPCWLTRIGNNEERFSAVGLVWETCTCTLPCPDVASCNSADTTNSEPATSAAGTRTCSTWGACRQRLAGSITWPLGCFPNVLAGVMISGFLPVAVGATGCMRVVHCSGPVQFRTWVRSLRSGSASESSLFRVSSFSTAWASRVVSAAGLFS